ncbi:hypothetical protein L7F22_056415 [Adiantum nelumboides]|nr:hypothetical protein [Adiantum nelumboides]
MGEPSSSWQNFNFQDDEGSAQGMQALRLLLAKLQEAQANPRLKPSVNNLLMTEDLMLTSTQRLPSSVAPMHLEGGEGVPVMHGPMQANVVPHPLQGPLQTDGAKKKQYHGQEKHVGKIREEGDFHDDDDEPPSRSRHKKRTNERRTKRSRRNSSGGSSSSSQSGRSSHGRFPKKGASEETPMLVNYLITRLQQAMANLALQCEVQQQLQAYGFIPPHQEERIPEKSLGETSKRGTSKVDFYVMPSKGEGYPLILGRPWLMEVNADQKWGSDKLVLQKGKRIVYDMKLGKQSNICFETSTDEESSDESSYGDEESYTSEESSMEVMGLVFQQPQAKGSSTSKEVEVVAKEEPMMEERLRKMLSKDLTKEEEEDYINMFKRYPHLFITDYSMIKGVDVIQHHIDLKPDAKPVAQKLRRLGVVQQEALLSEVNKLLKAGLIYPVTNSEWVSPVVVTPKKNELQEYEYTFIVEDSTRAGLADVLTYKVKEKKITPKAQGKLDFSPQGELEDAYTLLFDGAYRKQRNKAAGGFVILNEEKKEVLKKGIQLHLAHSNNEVEYATLKAGLEECMSMGIKRLMVKGDALLIVRQVQGTWACKNSKLLQWLHEVKLLMKDFEAIQTQHISRQHNKEADNMANNQFEVMVGAIKFKEPLFQGQETMENILYFLETGECPKHLERVQRHRLVRKALSYQLIGEHLYHKGKDLVLRRVPLVKEIEKILMSCHDGVCGGHFAQEITSGKILQAGFVWLSLHRDVQHWCKACKACQQAGDRKLSYGPRFPIFAYGPFEKWGIDAIGPLPRTSTNKQYILTATDYMTRWAKAASVARITAADVSKFVLDYICSRFGTPLEILSDRGPGFRADLLNALLENLSIKHVHSTPYYPQCNGLVEKTNGVLCKIITKHVRDRPQDWDKHLTAALWAYRTSFKVSTQFTPYHLVYGQEALLPIEVELGSLRVLAREATSSKEKLEQRILDLQ